MSTNKNLLFSNKKLLMASQLSRLILLSWGVHLKITKKKCIVILLFFSLLTLSYSSLSQCNNSIIHTSGSKIVSCTNVSVSSLGIIDTNTIYCNSTSPYFIGYNHISSANGNGSYTFNFTPPISSLTLNFSGISESPGNIEEISIKINGLHYPIPSIGTPNGCDPLAILNSRGNIVACNNCGASGWNGTTIIGSIYSLTVLDTIIGGDPAGTIFSLFICDGSFNPKNHIKYDTVSCRNEKLVLKAPNVYASYLWQDSSTNSSYTVQQQGIYWVKTIVNNCERTDTINVQLKDCDFFIEIPNVFTPNEDGTNDAWHFEVKHATNLSYSIYNRWGNLLKSVDLKGTTLVSWDGRTTSGEACTAGVYFYVLSYTDAKGAFQKRNGYISLIK